MHQCSLCRPLPQLRLPLLLPWNFHRHQESGGRVYKIFPPIQDIGEESGLSEGLVKAEDIVGMGGGYIFEEIASRVVAIVQIVDDGVGINNDPT